MGVPESQIADAVRRYGVCKVNIDTDLRLALTAEIRQFFATRPEEFDPRGYLGQARTAVVEMVREKLAMLNSAGRAADVVAHWQKLGSPVPDHYAGDAAA